MIFLSHHISLSHYHVGAIIAIGSVKVLWQMHTSTASNGYNLADGNTLQWALEPRRSLRKRLLMSL
jgi:hypothetical protein